MSLAGAELPPVENRWSRIIENAPPLPQLLHTRLGDGTSPIKRYLFRKLDFIVISFHDQTLSTSCVPGVMEIVVNVTIL